MALERLPYFKLHCADYLLDTLALTMPQHGAYCLLMFNYYWNGSLPTDRDELYALSHADTQEKKTDVDFVLRKFFREDNGAFTHNRIEREREKLGEMIRDNSRAGKASAKARAERPRKINGSEHGFAAFYSQYPRHVNRAKAEKAWLSIKPDDALQARIMQAVEAQKKSPQWVKDAGAFIPHPATWLNGKRWEDEVTTAANPTSYDPTKQQPC